MESRKRIKGFLLIEAVLAAVILAILAVSALTIFSAQQKLLAQKEHRAHAMTFAVSTAEKILTLVDSYSYYYPGAIPQLTNGEHTSATDPTICGLPDGYFKNMLKGNLIYTVETVVLDQVLAFSKVTIKVTWQEPDSEIINEETLVLAPAFCDAYYAMM